MPDQLQFIKAQRAIRYKGARPGITPREQFLREARHAAFAGALRTPEGVGIAPAVLGIGDGGVRYAYVDSPPLLSTFVQQSPSLTTAGRRLGAALASLHRMPTYWIAMEPAPRFVWSPIELTPASLTVLTSASLTYIRALQASEQLIECLDRLRIQEVEQTFIHRDATLSNVLASAGAQISLVDWELSGRGDPAVDVATVIGDGLWHWLADALSEDAEPLGEWINHNHPLFRSFRLLAQAVVSGYQTIGIADADKVARFVGVYVLTRVLAETESRGTFTFRSRLLAHIGKRVVVEPIHLWRLVG